MDYLTMLNGGAGTELNFSVLAVSLGLAFVLGLAIALVYRKISRGFSYDSQFNFALIMVTVIVDSIMMTIGSNIALSLGLIGSLSIIRFRTAIKSPMDMAFLFWSIATGLAVGARNFPIALASFLILGGIVLFLGKTRTFFRANVDYVLVIKTAADFSAPKISEKLDEAGWEWKLKSSLHQEDYRETVYSVYSGKALKTETVISGLKKIEGVKSVSLLSPDTNLFI